MRIGFNPPGTHIKKRLLRVRIDLRPDPTDRALYAMHHVQVPVFPPGGYPGLRTASGLIIDHEDYKRWEANLPRVWQLNPCLCSLVTISETTTVVDIQEFIARTFDEDMVKALSNSLVRPDSAHLISALMRGKGTLSLESVKTRDMDDLIASTKIRFSSLAIQLQGNGRAYPIEPQSIDVGEAAIDRPGSGDAGGTYVAEGNAANATGTIDTIQIYAASNMTVCEVASFAHEGSNVLSTNGIEAIGDVTAGSTQTFSNRTMAINQGEHIGDTHDTGSIDYEWPGGTGMWYDFTHDYIPCSSQAFDHDSGYFLSLCGTGEEPSVGIGALSQRLNPFGVNKYGAQIG